MSGAVSSMRAKLSSLRHPFQGKPAGGILNASGNAGPRRLGVIVASALGLLGLIVWALVTGQRLPDVSRDARLMPVDPLPGGLHTTPEQDAVALKANDSQAQAAKQKGVSYVPPMAPSQPVQPAPSSVELPAPQTPIHQPAFVGRPALSLPASGVSPVPVHQPGASPAPIKVAATTADPKSEEDYAKQINEVFGRWGARTPRTDIVLTPPDAGGGDPADASRQGQGSGTTTARNAASATPVSSRGNEVGEVLIPAGRGIYAHPILAANSDASSPVVLEADSGPIAGDRMEGTFAKQSDRLVIHVSSVIHKGETIGVDGVVIAPDTMEAAVASNVDQHYVSRFLLPAAAAFVSGLGQAIEQTSNTQSVLSPFGGAAFATQLNLRQQLGIAAGAAAAQVGATLNQAAPKGPTVSLEPNVSVGVMFLSNVVARRGP